jgi:hypothetical protein
MGYMPALKIYQNKKNYTIYFTHVPSSEEVSFPAIIKNFQDQFSSTHSPTEVYGRMDPIYTFQRTKRKIMCTFDCIATSKLEAYENLANMSKLITFLYPTYRDINSASTISSPPLFRIKLMNLMQSADPPSSNANGGDDNDDDSANIGDGLLGFVDGFTYNPPFGTTAFVDDYNFITPISFPVSFNMNVVHEHDLGWSQGDTRAFTKPNLFAGDVQERVETLAAATEAATQAAIGTSTGIVGLATGTATTLAAAGQTGTAATEPDAR